ncbi:MAG: CCA tRNA nucleotidyltransferase [Bulleidia sp.]
MIEIPSDVLEIMDDLEKAGHECYVVGGAVRSAVLNLPVHDYDLTTDALPKQMKEIFSHRHTFDTGIAHGTITVLAGNHPVEITTYRKDTGYQDHRHPDHVEFTSKLQEDCARRDFTINAFCYNPHTGFVDFFDGMRDLNSRTIRCIGDPAKRFDEDALRILRAIRFASQLHFTIEKNTADAIHVLKDTLSYVSMERIREETVKYLCGDGCASLFREYVDVFSVYLRELKQADDETLQTLVQRLQYAQKKPVIVMAVLLSTPCFDAPRSVLKRMKFSNHETDEIMNLIRLKDMPLRTRMDIRWILKDLKTDFSIYLAFREALDQRRYVDAHAFYDQIVQNHDCTDLKHLAVNGSDVVKYGYRGKQISVVLDEILKKVIEETLPNDRDVLLAYLSSRTR